MSQRVWKSFGLFLLLVGVLCVPRAPVDTSPIPGSSPRVTWIDRELVPKDDSADVSSPHGFPILIDLAFSASDLPSAKPAPLGWLLPPSDSSALQDATLSRQIPRAPPAA